MSTPSGSTAPLPPESFVPPTAEELGAMLPHYEISHLIAAGGMGAVYAGMQRALDRAVAIKILPPDAGRDGESISRFRTEAKAMARLTHPNIPAVYDFDVSAGYCYLVMEYVDGWNVHQLIAQRELTPELTYNLLSQVCDALHFAHQRGIVHGDIKPSNLLVTQEGTVKLSDFGLAQLTGSREEETYAPMGTPEYAAPELWQPGGVMDHRADLYSLGCVFFEMLTGAPPQGQFQLPGAVLKLDARVDKVIAKCMQEKPDLRYQSALEIRRAIDAIRAPAPGTAATRPAVRIVRPPARRPGSGGGSAARRRAKKSSSGARLGWLGVLGLGIGAAVIFSNQKPAPAPPGPPRPPETKTPNPVNSPATGSPSGTLKESMVPPPPPAGSRKSEVATPAPPSGQGTSEKPRGPVFSPETAEKLTTFRTKYRTEWQSNINGKLTTERDRLAAFYLGALDKFREEVMKLGDGPALLAVRNEMERFNRTREGLPESKLSAVAKLATLQKTLTTSLANAQTKLKPAADQLREKCLLELRQIETAAPTDDQEALGKLYDQLVAAPDLALALGD